MAYMDDPSGISHERWVELAQARSHEAFTVLFEYHKVGVHRYIIGIIGKEESAADLSQDTFLKAWEGLPSLRTASHFKAWLYRIARNLAYDYLRKHREIVSYDWAVRNLIDPAESGTNPEETSIQAEAIVFALATLPLKQRECWFLQYDGFSAHEIAQVLGIQVSSAKTYASSARRKLRIALHIFAEQRSN